MNKITGELELRRIKKPVVRAETGSTNDDVKLLLKNNAPDGVCVIALAQSAGRGRMGRPFHSPKDDGLYLSVGLRGVVDAAMLTGCAGVAVCRALEDACGLAPAIKWVNDLLYGGRKVCGILAEGVFVGGRQKYTALGVGINVNQDMFPAQLADTATSIFMQTGERMPVPVVAASVLRELDILLVALVTGDTAGYVDEYRRRQVILNKTVYYEQGGAMIKAVALDVDDELGLVVRREDGMRETLRAGEVSLRKIDPA